MDPIAEGARTVCCLGTEAFFFFLDFSGPAFMGLAGAWTITFTGSEGCDAVIVFLGMCLCIGSLQTKGTIHPREPGSLQTGLPV